jgi:hypothetical protein
VWRNVDLVDAVIRVESSFTQRDRSTPKSKRARTPAASATTPRAISRGRGGRGCGDAARCRLVSRAAHRPVRPRPWDSRQEVRRGHVG